MIDLKKQKIKEVNGFNSQINNGNQIHTLNSSKVVNFFKNIYNYNQQNDNQKLNDIEKKYFVLTFEYYIFKYFILMFACIIYVFNSAHNNSYIIIFIIYFVFYGKIFHFLLNIKNKSYRYNTTLAFILFYFTLLLLNTNDNKFVHKFFILSVVGIILLNIFFFYLNKIKLIQNFVDDFSFKPFIGIESIKLLRIDNISYIELGNKKLSLENVKLEITNSKVYFQSRDEIEQRNIKFFTKKEAKEVYNFMS